jgi:hypothetical protein
LFNRAWISGWQNEFRQFLTNTDKRIETISSLLECSRLLTT